MDKARKHAHDALKEGKLPPELLSTLLRQTSRHSSIRVGAAAGEDAAVVSGRRNLVVTADPVTLTGASMGSYVVAINGNDIVAMGGEPKYLTTTVLLPVGTTEEAVTSLFREIGEAASRAELLWVGGHSEVTSAVERVVISGHAVGFVYHRPLTTSGARPGDSIIMTKWVGLEGCTLLARSHRRTLGRLLGERVCAEVSEWLHVPGISIAKEGRLLRRAGLTSGHDPTEGGIASGIHEICARSLVDARIYYDLIPIREPTLRICAHWHLDPLGLLSSGVFLFTAREAAARACRRTLERHGIPCAIIGTITPREKGLILVKENRELTLPLFPQDELLRVPEEKGESGPGTGTTSTGRAAARDVLLEDRIHDIKNPLSHIIGFTELVLDGSLGSLTPRQEEYLRDILAGGHRLLDMVNGWIPRQQED
jgi:hydrogenase maturation factor